MYEVIKLKTDYMTVTDVTDKVKAIVKKSGVKDGICVIFNAHTTAAVGIATKEEAAQRDFQADLDRIFPLRANYNHVETPFDAAGHVKCVVVGVDVNPIIKDGELDLGDDQAILFYEFDGPRPRELHVKCYGK